jgi:hypothetical protein
MLDISRQNGVFLEKKEENVKEKQEKTLSLQMI